jgi:hypothetical protein
VQRRNGPDLVLRQGRGGCGGCGEMMSAGPEGRGGCRSKDLPGCGGTCGVLRVRSPARPLVGRVGARSVRPRKSRHRRDGIDPVQTRGRRQSGLESRAGLGCGSNWRKCLSWHVEYFLKSGPSRLDHVSTCAYMLFQSLSYTHLPLQQMGR